MAVVANPTIGSIVERKGYASITREAGAVISVEEAQIPEIVINDTAETQNGRIKI